MKIKDRNLALALMSLMVCLWGLDYVFASRILTELAPLNLMFFKYMIGFLFMTAVRIKTKEKEFIRPRDIPLFLLCSVTGVILYFYCDYNAISYIPVSLVTVILAFVPVVSILIEKIVFRRHFTPLLYVGIAISVIGVAIVIGADLDIFRGGRAAGYLFAFGAVLSWNAYNFLAERFVNQYSFINVGWSMLLSTLLLLLPYNVATLGTVHLTGNLFAYFLYLGLGSAGIGYLILPYGLKHLGPTISGMFSNFMPVTSTIFGWIFLNQHITLVQIAGGAIVVAASCLVIKEKDKKVNDHV